MALKILSFNVKGLNSPYKRSLMWSEAISQARDIICIQETHLRKDNPPNVSHKAFPHIHFANAKKKQKGVLIAIRVTVSYNQLFIELDPGGSYIILGAEINNRSFTIVNLYAPITRQKRFLTTVVEKARKLQIGNLIVCGDFNDISDPTLDSTSKKRRGARGFLLCWRAATCTMPGGVYMGRRGIIPFSPTLNCHTHK